MDIKERIQDLTLDQKAKLYFMGLLRKGLIDTLPEDPKAAYIRDMMDKENPRMDPAIRSDFDDPTLENLKEAATELGYLNENMPKGVSDYDMLRSFQKDELLDDLGDIIAKYVKDPDDIDREIDRFDIGGFDNMSNMVKANLGRDPEYKALAKKFNLNEGDTYEKMAAKGKKAGNLKQGTVRKRLKIKDGEKIPLSKINKAISKIKKMENPSEKNKKFLKALNLAKTLKTTTNVNEEENPVVAKGDGMEITRKEMAMLHKNGKVRLKDGSILTFINKKDKAN